MLLEQMKFHKHSIFIAKGAIAFKAFKVIVQVTVHLLFIFFPPFIFFISTEIFFSSTFDIIIGLLLVFDEDKKFGTIKEMKIKKKNELGEYGRKNK
jgi:hypothetical protein